MASRVLSVHFGLTENVPHLVGDAILQDTLAPELLSFADRLLPQCWLEVCLDSYCNGAQLSFFVVCDPSSPLAARVRLRGKRGGLSYMTDADLSAASGAPLAHCTVCISNQLSTVSVSFLEKDRQRRAGDLNLGVFLLGVTLCAVAPIVMGDATLSLVAHDAGTGRLVDYYRRLGLEPKQCLTELSGQPFEMPMAAKLSAVRAACTTILSADASITFLAWGSEERVQIAA